MIDVFPTLQDIMLGSMDPDGPMQKTRKLIVDNGAWFNNAFANTPICCPSRSEIQVSSCWLNLAQPFSDCSLQSITSLCTADIDDIDVFCSETRCALNSTVMVTMSCNVVPLALAVGTNRPTRVVCVHQIQ